MADDAPGYQSDGAFQLAADFGFQTTGLPANRIVADLGLVLALDATITSRPGPPPGPRPPTAVWVPRRRQRRRDRIAAALGLVLALDARITSRPPPRRRDRLPAELEAGDPQWAATWRSFDVVAEVLWPEEEEWLALL